MHVPNAAVLGQLGAVLNRPLAYFYAIDDDMAGLVTVFHRASVKERQKLMSSLPK